MDDAVLWTGLLLLAGTAAAMAGLALKLPAATGALMGGFLLAAALRGADLLAQQPATAWLSSMLLALLCFLLGAEIDLTRIARMRQSILVTATAQAVCVTALVGLAGAALGLGWRVSAILGAAAAATSPAALMAVASEARARGEMTQRILTLAPLSLLAAIALGATLSGDARWAAMTAGALAAGIACGLVILAPLSRLTSRGAIVSCAAGGAFLLAGASTLTSQGMSLPLTAAISGFMAGSFIPNRENVRDVLRDLALPCTVALFAIEGAGPLKQDLSRSFYAALLVVAARAAGLFLAGALARGNQGSREAAAQIPMAAMTSGAIPGLLILREPEAADAAAILLAAGFISTATGMIGTRWALLRSGEAPLTPEDPEAWRAPLR